MNPKPNEVECMLNAERLFEMLVELLNHHESARLPAYLLRNAEDLIGECSEQESK